MSLFGKPGSSGRHKSDAQEDATARSLLGYSDGREDALQGQYGEGQSPRHSIGSDDLKAAKGLPSTNRLERGLMCHTILQTMLPSTRVILSEIRK